MKKKMFKKFSEYKVDLIYFLFRSLHSHLLLVSKVQKEFVKKYIARYDLVIAELYILLLHHLILRLLYVGLGTYLKSFIIFMRLFRNSLFSIMFLHYFGIKYLYVLLIIFIIIFVLYYLYCKLYKKMSKVDFWRKQLSFVNSKVLVVKLVLVERMGVETW